LARKAQRGAGKRRPSSPAEFVLYRLPNGAVRAEEVVADLSDLDLHRHAHLDLLVRAWKLRDNVSAYDAVYIALAEAMEAAIVTCDGPLAKAPGTRVRIELIT
jgi:predicted nucleic acid-binding protein